MISPLISFKKPFNAPKCKYLLYLFRQLIFTFKIPPMKKSAIVSFCCLLIMAIPTLAQKGKVYDNLSLSSSILKSDRKIAIYHPPDYETSERSYPVLYLLHGSGDDQTGWVQFGEVLHITD